jgi:surfeit locus 1 family protein
MFKSLIQVQRPASRLLRSHNTCLARRLFTTETEQPVVREVYRAKQRKFGIGTLLLCTIPFVTFGLGTWQVQRLRWKVNYIQTLEDRMDREAIPLPKRIK